MKKYQVLPKMDESSASTRIPAPLRAEAVNELADEGMRCGGCGAKVGADVLAAALADIGTVSREDVLIGLDAPDDAALISVPEGRLSVLSVDAFRPMFQDPYLFGRITANHCLGDVHAMGAEPQAAMALATLPVWPEAKLIDELRQMLLGALDVFGQEGVSLVGGHTSEGAEQSLGFAVTGLIEPGCGPAQGGPARGRRAGADEGAGHRDAARGGYARTGPRPVDRERHRLHAAVVPDGRNGAAEPRRRRLHGRHRFRVGRPPLRDARRLVPGRPRQESGAAARRPARRTHRSGCAACPSRSVTDRHCWPAVHTPAEKTGVLRHRWNAPPGSDGNPGSPCSSIPRPRAGCSRACLGSNARACLDELAANGYADSAVIGRIEDAGRWGKRLRLKAG